MQVVVDLQLPKLQNNIFYTYLPKLQRWLRNIVSNGRPSITVHTIRHSFATRYHQENNDVPKLRNQLGHSAIQTTMIYTHLTSDELKKAVDNMDKVH